MTGLRLSDLLEPVMQLAYEAGLLIESELNRPDGPRGSGFKADVDVEIEVLLRQRLKHILNCDFVGEETGCELSGHPFSWVVDPNDGTGDFLNRRPGSAIVSERASHLAGGDPVVRQQLVELTGLLRR